MKIYGFLICTNGVNDILRCLDSVASVVDEYFVMDGGSTDGTLEILKNYQKSYNLNIFEHPYDQQDNQRNRLLEKIPKDSWVVALDCDEKLSWLAQQEMRSFLANVEYPGKRELPLTIGMPFYDLVNDPNHYIDPPHALTIKIFYNDRNLHFIEPYHSRLVYDDDKEFTNMKMAPNGWAVLHYAFLNQKRLDSMDADVVSGIRQYTSDWYKLEDKIIKELPSYLH